eukprot:2834027-Amphidinium_carterae.1
MMPCLPLLRPSYVCPAILNPCPGSHERDQACSVGRGMSAHPTLARTFGSSSGQRIHTISHCLC